MKATWRKLVKVLAAVAGVAWLGAWAQAQDAPTPPSVEERLQKLEQQNEALRKIIDNLQKEEPGRVPANEVQRLVQSYLQEEKGKEEKKDAGKSAAPGWHEVGSDLKMNARWNNGLQLETANGDFKMKIGGRLHQPWVWLNSEDTRLRNDPNIGNYQDAVFFRRARLRTEGTCWEVIDWVAEYEFGLSDEVRFRELFFDIKNLPILGNFRAGEIIEPNGFETMTSDRYITFVERNPLHNVFYPEYNPGMMIFNHTPNQRVTWQLALARDDGGTDIGRVLGDGFYNYDARITTCPWYENDGRSVFHLGGTFHHSSAIGKDRTLRLATPPSFRQGRSTPAIVDTGVVTADGFDVLGGELFLNLGPFNITSEAAVSQMNNALRAGRRTDPTMWGGYVQASYFLTGEHLAYDKRFGRGDRLKVHEPFYCVRTEDESDRRLSLGRGAWQIAARYSYLDLQDPGDNLFGGAFHDVVVGLNWYLNANFRISWEYFWANRDQGAPVAAGPGSGRGSLNGAMMVFMWDF